MAGLISRWETVRTLLLLHTTLFQLFLKTGKVSITSDRHPNAIRACASVIITRDGEEDGEEDRGVKARCLMSGAGRRSDLGEQERTPDSQQARLILDEPEGQTSSTQS